MEATKKLLSAVPAAIADPKDASAQKKVYDAAQEVAEATQQLVGDTGRQVAVSALYNSAKLAVAATTRLCTSSQGASVKVHDNQVKQQLNDAAKSAAEAGRSIVKRKLPLDSISHLLGSFSSRGCCCWVVSDSVFDPSSKVDRSIENSY